MSNKKIFTDVEMVEISILKPNPLNSKIFGTIGHNMAKDLMRDIEDRGIITALQVKKDNTLLSGHMRLMAAQALGFKKVPVQYYKNKLTEEEEKDFIVKDNLLRRQISKHYRIELYRTHVNGFDERVLQSPKSGLMANAKEVSKKLSEKNIDIPETTIKKDITKIRAVAKSKQTKLLNKNKSDINPNDMRNVTLHCNKIRGRLLDSNKKTLKRGIIKVREVADELEIIYKSKKNI